MFQRTTTFEQSALSTRPRVVASKGVPINEYYVGRSGTTFCYAFGRAEDGRTEVFQATRQQWIDLLTNKFEPQDDEDLDMLEAAVQACRDAYEEEYGAGTWKDEDLVAYLEDDAPITTKYEVGRFMFHDSVGDLLKIIEGKSKVGTLADCPDPSELKRLCLLAEMTPEKDEDAWTKIRQKARGMGHVAVALQ